MSYKISICLFIRHLKSKTFRSNKKSQPKMCKIDNLINRAIDISMKSPLVMRHGCLIMKNGSIVSEGFNNSRTMWSLPSNKNLGFSKETYYKLSKIFNNTKCSCHAEMHAVHRLLWFMSKTSKNLRRNRHEHCKLSCQV